MQRFLAVAAFAAIVGCDSNPVSQRPFTPESIVLSPAQKHSLDSTGQVIKEANPGNVTLHALVDSTLQTLAAGVEARRLDVSTNFTDKPLYFVGIHRAVQQGAASAFSTWTLVGFDDPAHLTVLMEVSGFAASATAVAPSSQNSSIGNGGFVNGFFLDVATGGAVNMRPALSGTVSFTSTAGNAACPGFLPIAKVTCTLEALTSQFNIAAGSVNASVSSPTDAPGIRLIISP